MFNSSFFKGIGEDQLAALIVEIFKKGNNIFSVLNKVEKKNELKILEKFLEKNGNNIDINCINEQKSTPLCIAAEKNNFAAAKILIDYGASITIPTGKGETPIDIFMNYGNQEAVNYLQHCLNESGNILQHSDII